MLLFNLKYCHILSYILCIEYSKIVHKMHKIVHKYMKVHKIDRSHHL